MTTPATPPARPIRWKQAVVTWLGIYPTITVLLYLIGPYLFGRLPLWAIALVLTLIMVPISTWIVMPRLLRWFGPWMHRG